LVLVRLKGRKRLDLRRAFCVLGLRSEMSRLGRGIFYAFGIALKSAKFAQFTINLVST
jgi:hypothetical protein